MSPNVIISVGSFNAALAITLSAFAAHGLQQHLDNHQLQTFKTACEFHLWHGFGITLLGLITPSIRSVSRIAWLMLSGILLFCGSLYVLSTTGLRWMAWITPFGGVAFIAAWIWLSWAALKNN